MASTSNPFDVKTTKPAQVTAPAAPKPPKMDTSAYDPNTQTAAAAKGYTYDPATYDADKMKTTDWTVGKNQTVQGQLQGILASNSPLLQRARAQSLVDANSLGLRNSSMAVQAGQGAVMDRALQIATPDAQTYASSAQFNANSKNQAAATNMQAENQERAFNANSQNDAGKFNASSKSAASSQNAQAQNALQQSQLDRSLQAGLAQQSQATQMAMQQYDAAFKSAIANADAANQQQLQLMDGQIKSQLASIEAQFKNQMQASASTATMYSDTIKTIGAIMTDPNMDAGAKQNAINQQMAAFQASLKLQSAISDVPGLDKLIVDLGGATKPPAKPPAAPPPPAPPNFDDYWNDSKGA